MSEIVGRHRGAPGSDRTATPTHSEGRHPASGARSGSPDAVVGRHAAQTDAPAGTGAAILTSGAAALCGIALLAGPLLHAAGLDRAGTDGGPLAGLERPHYSATASGTLSATPVAFLPQVHVPPASVHTGVSRRSTALPSRAPLGGIASAQTSAGASVSDDPLAVRPTFATAPSASRAAGPAPLPGNPWQDPVLTAPAVPATAEAAASGTTGPEAVLPSTTSATGTAGAASDVAPDGAAEDVTPPVEPGATTMGPVPDAGASAGHAIGSRVGDAARGAGVAAVAVGSAHAATTSVGDAGHSSPRSAAARAKRTIPPALTAVSSATEKAARSLVHALRSNPSAAPAAASATTAPARAVPTPAAPAAAAGVASAAAGLPLP